jgi:DNA processing protein
MDHEERLAAIRLHLTSGIGPRLYTALVEHFGSARAATEASPAALAEVSRVGDVSAQKIRDGVSHARAEEELEKAERAGVRICVRGEPTYPIALGYLYDAPPVLYVKGTVLPQDAMAMGIVGMRKCSLYGKDQAERFAGGLARTGFTVVSGLARGVDSAAHQAALGAGGRTIAVLGNGLSTIYPPENKRLADAVTERGALVTELAMDIGPTAENFPRRNRILAALSLGVIVIEAGKQSGSLITARLAAELGKEVFALPNRVDAPGASGVHALIRDGAKLIESVADVLDEFPDLGITVPGGEEAAPQATLTLKANLSPEESRLMEVLDGEPVQLDVLAIKSGVAVAKVSGALTLLELKGMVRALPGGRFARRAAKQ